MSDRKLETILAEWRALEQRFADSDEAIAAQLAAELTAIREEYARVFAARREDAEDVARTPGRGGA